MVDKIVNGHLNNLITSTSSNEVNGWTIDCAGGVWNADDHDYDDVCYNWYGYTSGMVGMGNMNSAGASMCRYTYMISVRNDWFCCTLIVF